MNTDEFIALYNQGKRNFKGKNLPGLDIKGGTIREVDFEEANLLIYIHFLILI
jgi:hypothetical protein